MSAATNQLREVVIIASGGANIASLQFALERLGASSVVAADARSNSRSQPRHSPRSGRRSGRDVATSPAGTGHRDSSLQQPVLGVCLGMQLLYEASEEGGTNCLGIIPGRAARFAPRAERPVPHMGWNTLAIERPCPLLEGIRPGDYAYFVHSYSLTLSSATVASSSYGDPFSACVQWRNFYGAQFHPERSAKVGARLLENFLGL